MSRQQELESILTSLLSALKKNREAVSPDLLRSYYREPYQELIKQINQTATAYAKSIALDGFAFNPYVSIDTQVAVINEAIARSGLLKEMGHSLSTEYSVEKLYAQALELKKIIRDAIACWSLEECS